MDYRVTDFSLRDNRRAALSERLFPFMRYLPGVFMVAFLLTGLALSLFNQATYELPVNKSVLDGSWTATYQSNYEKGLAVQEPALNIWTALTFGLFREGRPGLIVGERNWLFVNEELFAFNPSALSYQNNLTFISSVARYLEGLGINVLIAPVPAKANIYPEHLGRYFVPESARARYDTFLNDLRALDIPSVDLRVPLQQARAEELMFLPSDTHWTPQGAKVSAASVSSIIREEQLVSSLGETPYRTVKIGKERHRGDLRNFLPFGFLEPVIDFPRDRLERFEAQRKNGFGGDLFAEVSIPVALVGTSYSADPRWYFEGALQVALGADVLNAATPGEGPFVPMVNYLSSPAFETTRPELVIWEIPERYLATSYDIPLTLAELTEDTP